MGNVQANQRVKWFTEKSCAASVDCKRSMTPGLQCYAMTVYTESVCRALFAYFVFENQSSADCFASGDNAVKDPKFK